MSGILRNNLNRCTYIGIYLKRQTFVTNLIGCYGISGGGGSGGCGGRKSLLVYGVVKANHFASSASAATNKKEVPLKNEEIKIATLRVILKDEVTGEPSWKLMSRKDALTLARSMSLDLVLVNAKASPPVAKLEDFGELMLEQKKKQKTKKAASKVHSIKEMFIGAMISSHDLSYKLEQVKDFLATGHKVKVSVVAKKANLLINPVALDETTLKVLDALETVVSTVQQPEGSTPYRKEFVLNPLKATIAKGINRDVDEP